MVSREGGCGDGWKEGGREGREKAGDGLKVDWSGRFGLLEGSLKRRLLYMVLVVTRKSR